MLDEFRSVTAAKHFPVFAQLSRAPRAARGGVLLARTLRLDRRTGYGTVGAEYAAVSRLWPQDRAASAACIKNSARLGRHCFQCRGATIRASNHGLLDHFVISPVWERARASRRYPRLRSDRRIWLLSDVRR